MIEFFSSTYFLGILLMSASCAAFCVVFFPSWFAGSPRRFWTVHLTYENEKELQTLVRFAWLVAWCLAVASSLLVACNDSRIPQTFWWILGDTCYSIAMILVIAKLVVVLSIFVWKIWLGVIYLKDWCCND